MVELFEVAHRWAIEDLVIIYNVIEHVTIGILLSMKQSCQVVDGVEGGFGGNRLMLVRAFDTIVGLRF